MRNEESFSILQNFNRLNAAGHLNIQTMPKMLTPCNHNKNLD